MPTKIRNPAVSTNDSADRLPSPPTPHWADLRKFQSMPVDCRSLRDSPMVTRLSAEAFRAAILLRLASWHARPAGSLPDDDRELAQLAGLGTAVKQWRKIRAEALFGWEKCSDSRLYCPEISEKVAAAINEQIRFAWRRECDRLRKIGERCGTRSKLPSFEQYSAKFRNSGGAPVAENDADPAGEGADVSDGQAPDVRRTNPTCPADPLREMESNREESNREEEGTPPSEESTRPRADRGTRLPDAWQPSLEDRSFAQGLGLDPEAVAAQFRDFWAAAPGARGRKASWPATWRTWCRREAASGSGRMARAGAAHSQNRPTDVRAAEARRNADRIRELEAELRGAHPEPAADLFAGPTIEGKAS